MVTNHRTRTNDGHEAESRESNPVSKDETICACADCGEPLTDDRPVHRVVLEIADRTRSTKRFMGDETNITRYCLGRSLCGPCWEGWHDRLVSE